MNNFELAEEITINILPKFFSYRLFETFYSEDGSVSKLTTEKADNIIKEICDLLDKNSKDEQS